MKNKCSLDLDKLCRLCLKDDDVKFQIFDTDDAELSIPMRIITCISLEVKQQDGLPKLICSDCRYQLEKSFIFRKKSQSTDSKLRKHIRLLSLGKKSRVFDKSNDDETDEDELEFEDSIRFIKEQESLRNKNDAQWRENYKNKVEGEFQKKLDNFKIDCESKLRKEVTEKVRLELRSEVRNEVKLELRSEVASEMRDEVKNECRKEQIKDLLWEMEVFLNEKQARERIGTKYIIERAAQNADILSEPLQARKRRRISLTNTKSDNSISVLNDIKIVGVTEVSEAENVEENSDENMDTNQADGSDEIYILHDENQQKSEDAQQEFEQDNINDVVESQTYELESEDKITADNSITSYKIKDNGEIQYCENTKSSSDGKEQKAAKAQQENVVLLDFCTDFSDEIVEFVDVQEKFIVVKNTNSAETQNTEVPKKRIRSVQSSGKLFTKLNGRNNGDQIHSIENLNPAPQRITDTVKTFACKLCPIVFSTENSLTRHMRSHSKVQEKGVHHQCPVCQLYVSCSSALKRHMMIHTGVRPYSCNECGKSFVQREILKRHMDTHTGVRPYECPHCHQRFAQKTNLQTHISKLHLEEPKLHACHLCPKKFTHSSGLSRHLTSHSGIVYKCLTCDRHFGDRSSIKRHITHIHGVTDKTNDNMIVTLPAKSNESESESTNK